MADGPILDLPRQLLGARARLILARDSKSRTRRDAKAASRLVHLRAVERASGS